MRMAARTVRRSLRTKAAAWLIIAALAAAGCARHTPRARAGRLQIDINTSPVNLDPRAATDAISACVGELVYDSLMRVDPNGRFVGDLAESVERPAPDVMVFHLRRGVRFSDGRPLDARDVKYTYDSVLAPANRSVKRAALAEMAALDPLDDHTIRMTTRRPYAAALEMALLGVVPRGTPLDARDAIAAPPGSGPFMVAGFRRDAAVTLARNPYHPAPAGALGGIVMKVVPDATVRALELTEGICDFAENDAIQPELIQYLARQPGLRVIRSSGTTYQYLIFNFRDPRLRDLRVRRAIAYAIDRDAIVATLLRGGARVASGMLAPENWAYTGAVTRYAHDPARARALLEAAGYSRAHPLRLVYKTTPEGRRLAEVIQAMLLRVGVAIEIRTNEFATFYSDLRAGNFDLAASQWVGVADPHQYYLIFDSRMTPRRGGNNRGGYANPQMDRLLVAGDAALDPAVRRAIYAQVQQLAAADLPYVSLWWIDNVAVLNRRLEGFEPFPNGSLLSLAAARFAPPAAAAPMSLQ